MSESIREIVLKSLYAICEEGKKSHLLIRDVLDKYDYLSVEDKAFYKYVTGGTVSSMLTLDYVLDLYSSKPMRQCKPYIRLILRMSAYQILYMDRVPDHAVINEAVNLCKKCSVQELSSFVNGVLRTLARNKNTVLDFSSIEPESKRLSVMYSVPEWIVSMFLKEQKDAKALLEELCRPRPTAVLVRDEVDLEKLAKEWESAGYSYRKSELVPRAFLFDSLKGLQNLPGFSDGKLIVQDESSMETVRIALENVSNPSLCMDVCAAPGGKSAHLASKILGRGVVISRDVSETKIEKIRENITRLSLTNVKTEVYDATNVDEQYVGKADLVLCDVPCSGLGVIARKSDLRYNITNEAMKEICLLQKNIVLACSQYVKKGGTFLYSTCTIHKAENEKMVKFIEENTDLRCDYYKQFRPDIDHTDGFFAARFTR